MPIVSCGIGGSLPRGKAENLEQGMVTLQLVADTQRLN